MNANDSLERGIAEVYEREAPSRAPDWVLASILDAVDETPQRRGLIPAPWRFRHMNTFAKAAIAAVVVIAIGAVGLNMLGPRSPSGVGTAPSASPSATPPPSASPSPSQTAVSSAPPPLSRTFTSTMHGISISYPAGWAVMGATQNWIGHGVNWISPDIDYMYDPKLTSDLFIAMASEPLGGKTGERWVTDFMADPESDCPSGPSGPITVDGANGSICGGVVALSIADRGYFIRLYTSGDEGWLDTYYNDAWFRGLLATVQLHPENALDRPAPSSASPSS